MEQKELPLEGIATIYLAACELCGKAPTELGDISAEAAYAFARRSSLDAIAAASLERVGLSTEEMNVGKMASIRKNMLLDNGREALCGRLEAEGIYYMPLKGVILKELYPALGLRQMSDNDILFDPSRRADVRRIMEELGFESEEYGKGCHDVYLKKPVYNYEMHVSLFARTEGEELFCYFKDYVKRARLLEDTSYHYVLSDEDFYIYLKAHEYKHFSFGGTGIRSLLDTYVYLKAKPELSLDYVERELSKIGIADYEKGTRELALKLFTPEGALSLLRGELELSDGERELLSAFLGSGTYGSVGNRINNELSREADRGQKGAKLRYVFRRLFPPMEWYESNAPFFYKYKLLIPFFLLWRLIRGVLLRPVKTVRELTRVIKFKGKNKKNGI